MSEQATAGENPTDAATDGKPVTIEDAHPDPQENVACPTCGGTRQVTFQASPQCVGTKACPDCAGS